LFPADLTGTSVAKCCFINRDLCLNILKEFLFFVFRSFLVSHEALPKKRKQIGQKSFTKQLSYDSLNGPRTSLMIFSFGEE